jgi:hypothetical protein
MTSTNDTPGPTDPCPPADRTAHVSTEDGVVIYDVENPSGWLRSDRTVSLAERR